MNPVGAGTVQTRPSHPNLISQAPIKPDSTTTPLSVESNRVTLSEEGRALLAALQELEQGSTVSTSKDKTVGDKVESFTYGALGMDHPDNMKKIEDSSYSAGQYLSAAATIGGIVLALL